MEIKDKVIHYAEVEDQEAIVDGNKVVSNKITDEQGQSLAKKSTTTWYD